MRHSSNEVRNFRGRRILGAFLKKNSPGFTVRRNAYRTIGEKILKKKYKLKEAHDLKVSRQIAAPLTRALTKTPAATARFPGR